MSLPLVIAGHSHSGALGGFLEPRGHGMEVVPHPEDARFASLGSGPRDDRYWDDVVRLASRHHIGIVWGGNQHYSEFLFAPTPRFDVALSTRPDLPVDDTAVLVPELAIRAWGTPSLAGLEALLPRVRAAGGPGAVVLGTPPPKNASERLRQELCAQPEFLALARNAGVDAFNVSLTSPLLLLKLWLVIQDMMRAIAQSFGVPFCPSPKAAATPDGFLREEFWADVTHANRAYGALMLRDVAGQLCLEPPRTRMEG